MRRYVLWRRDLAPGGRAALLFATVTAGLFAINTAISGEWNYQGGDRKTFMWEFPFQTPAVDF